MATNTTNLNLIKPEGFERVQISQINQNMDILDSAIGAVGNTSLQGQVSTIKNKLINIPLFNNDCDGITETCTVYVGDSATGSPGPWSIMHTIVFDSSNAIVQYAISVPNGTMKMRSKTGNPASWTDWTLVSVNHNYLFGTTMNLSQFINLCETMMNSHPGFSQIGFINYQQAIDIGLPTSGYILGLYDSGNGFKKIIYYSTVDNSTYTLSKINGTWSQRWRGNTTVDCVNATIPVGTASGSYKVGTFASLGIPASSTILSCQCNNATSSYCPATGFSVVGNDIYVFLFGEVAVNNAQISIVYKTL